MQDDPVELTMYLKRPLPPGVIPTFKPDCELAIVSRDKKGYKIYTCPDRRLCIATNYLGQKEPVNDSSAMKTCQGNPKVASRLEEKTRLN